MLEFCTDICSYMINNKDSFAAVHCKAGKGRTGSMICAFLIFSGLAETSKEAMQLYAERRCESKKGVTVPSQKRYLQHFETFLNLTFTKPFYKQIPRIFHSLSVDNSSSNLLHNILINKSSEIYNYRNSFILKKIQVGPIKTRESLRLIINNYSKQRLFDSNNFLFQRRYKCSLKEEYLYEDGKSIRAIYVIFTFSDKESFDVMSDIEIIFKGYHMDFFMWLNLNYITLETLLDFISKKMLKEAIANLGKDKISIINDPDTASSFMHEDKTRSNTAMLKRNKLTQKEKEHNLLLTPSKGATDTLHKKNVSIKSQILKSAETKIHADLNLEHLLISKSGHGHKEVPNSAKKESYKGLKRRSVKVGGDPFSSFHNANKIHHAKQFSTGSSKSISSCLKLNNNMTANDHIGLYSRLKKYLEDNTCYLRNSYIQTSDLNLILNFLHQEYPNEIRNDKVFEFNVPFSGLDKYSGEPNKNMSINIIYILN